MRLDRSSSWHIDFESRDRGLGRNRLDGTLGELLGLRRRQLHL